MTEVSEATVGDVMQHGVLSCQAETNVRTIARMMSEHRTHSIVVTDLDGVSERAWGIITDVDLLRAAQAREVRHPLDGGASDVDVALESVGRGVEAPGHGRGQTGIGGEHRGRRHHQ